MNLENKVKKVRGAARRDICRARRCPLSGERRTRLGAAAPAGTALGSPLACRDQPLPAPRVPARAPWQPSRLPGDPGARTAGLPRCCPR